jgi:hypothetical protein
MPMDSIRIDSGVKQIAINDDESRVIEFNPKDIVFVERFYGLISEFEQKEVEFLEKARAIDDKKEIDAYGIPVNTGESLKLLLEMCNYLRSQIDKVFGNGTSQIVFGETQTLNMFEQFFTGITPFIQEEREDRVKQYKARR